MVVGLDFDSFLTNHVNVAWMITNDPRTLESLKSGSPIAGNFYQDLMQRYGVYENIFVCSLDKDATVIVDGVGGKSIGIKISEVKIEQSVITAKEGKAYLAKARKSPINGLPVALISVPILEGNHPIGLVGVALSFDSISEKIIKEIKIGEQGYVFAMEQEGIVIAHPEKDQVLNLDISKENYGKKILDLKTGNMTEFLSQGDEHYVIPYKLDYMENLDRSCSTQIRNQRIVVWTFGFNRFSWCCNCIRFFLSTLRSFKKALKSIRKCK